ncbi:MAG TPA: 3-dehydroquinate synthase [Verrucomicrobiae bacterium]|nr:3-dehydroquinate synthase [Verrucomicrobiae bacterium]
MQRVDVELGPRSYPILIADGLLRQAGRLAAEKIVPCQAAVVTSQPIARHYLDPLVASLRDAGFDPHPVLVPDGEAAKSFAALEPALSDMARAGLDRRSAVFALGGGAVGDAAGLLAALFMRGVPYAQIPTTLLAMVDSSVGGKTAVNLPQGKNLVGAFHQPALVIIDPSTLATLDDRELRASVAEIIKYGIISDAALFDQVATGRPSEWAAIIRRCCEIKARVVEQDEFERKDIRALLNFGHTIGHAVEAAGGYGGWLHGEAVALGMVAAARLSQRHANLSADEESRILAAIARHGLPVRWPELDEAKVWEIMRRDKKFRAGRMRFVLSDHIGHAFVSENPQEQDVRDAIAALRH